MYHTTIDVDDILTNSDKEYLLREGFTDDEINNKIERLLEIISGNMFQIIEFLSNLIDD